MISDITIGQYFPGNSLLHKMDARMKIILVLCLIVSLFICKNVVSLAVMVVLSIVIVAISKIPPKTILY